MRQTNRDLNISGHSAKSYSVKQQTDCNLEVPALAGAACLAFFAAGVDGLGFLAAGATSSSSLLRICTDSSSDSASPLRSTCAFELRCQVFPFSKIAASFGHIILYTYSRKLLVVPAGWGVTNTEILRQRWSAY